MPDLEFDRCSTETEIDNAEAMELGANRPTQAWVSVDAAQFCCIPPFPVFPNPSPFATSFTGDFPCTSIATTLYPP